MHLEGPKPSPSMRGNAFPRTPSLSGSGWQASHCRRNGFKGLQNFAPSWPQARLQRSRATSCGEREGACSLAAMAVRQAQFSGPPLPLPWPLGP